MNHLFPVRLFKLSDGFDGRSDAPDDFQLVLALDEFIQVVNQPILDNEAAEGNTEHQTQAPPENKRTRNDGLLDLLAAREDGYEGARELESLADCLWDEDEEVGDFGHAAVQEAEGDGADEVPDGAGEDRPLEASGPGYRNAGEGADDGCGDGRDDEAEARGGGAGEEDGLEVQGAECVS